MNDAFIVLGMLGLFILVLLANLFISDRKKKLHRQ